ncbi:MAG TPA: hypothetical protein VGJ60_02225 [Chloroflexota bacterium]
MSPERTLASKLLIKPGQHGALLNAPTGYERVLERLPEGAIIDPRLGGNLDFVLLFARNSGDVEEYAPPAIQALKPESLLWIAYPKGGKKAGTDLNRDILWELMSRFGWAGVTLVAVDDTWSAFRFRPIQDVGR